MQRRSFLQAMSSIVPAAALSEFIAASLEGQTPAAGTAVHVVGPGQDRFNKPVSFAFSPALLFKVSGSDTNGGLFVFEHSRLFPGGPALHQHWNQEEWFFVMDGAVQFQVGDQQLTLHAGESVLAPRKVPHAFSAVAPGPARLMIAFCPAGKMEAFFHALEANPKLVSDSAFWHEHEMDLLGPSPFDKNSPLGNYGKPNSSK